MILFLRYGSSTQFFYFSSPQSDFIWRNREKIMSQVTPCVKRSFCFVCIIRSQLKPNTVFYEILHNPLCSCFRWNIPLFSWKRKQKRQIRDEFSFLFKERVIMKGLKYMNGGNLKLRDCDIFLYIFLCKTAVLWHVTYRVGRKSLKYLKI